MQVVRIGLDLAKYVFEVHGVDYYGKVVVRKRLRRDAQWPLHVCAVTRRRFPVGASPARPTAPAGSNRSSHGGDEMAEAFGVAGHV